jgi:hypothetical protein
MRSYYQQKWLAASDFYQFQIYISLLQSLATISPPIKCLFSMLACKSKQENASLCSHRNIPLSRRPFYACPRSKGKKKEKHLMYSDICMLFRDADLVSYTFRMHTARSSYLPVLPLLLVFVSIGALKRDEWMGLLGHRFQVNWAPPFYLLSSPAYQPAGHLRWF